MTNILIIGPQCSGKTTIANYLEDQDIDFVVIDEDKEINRRNGGKSPSDWTEWNYKWTVLRPEIARDVLRMNKVIFLTSFFDEKMLFYARLNGFIVIQLATPDQVLKDRNKKRIERGIDDATYGWSINLPYHESIREQGLVDIVIETHRPVECIAQDILATADLFSRRIRMFPRPYWLKQGRS